MKNMYKNIITLSYIVSLSVNANILTKISPKLTEVWQPVDKVSTQKSIPSDAIVLFDGSNFDHWQHGDKNAVQWTLNDGAMTVKPGSKGIQSKESFCDIQLHVEWRTPLSQADRSGQHDGNSGIYLQGRYEIQVLNSFDNETYANGQAGAIYKQAIPLVNVSRPPMEWQSYDIIFNAPKFYDNNELKESAFVTVLHNGVLIHHHQEIQGSTVYRGNPKYKAHGCAPIYLQDHGSKVSYRNIWVRKLN